MEVTLTQNEGKMMVNIINRTTFQGQEAEAVVMLKQKLMKQLQETPEIPQPVKEEKKK